MASLDVFWNRALCGRLSTTADRGMVFSYADGWKRKISISLPILAKEYNERECGPFFSGLLPDGALREEMARAAHVSPTSVFRLLEAYGGDIAGALTFFPTEQPAPQGGYVRIGRGEIAEKIRMSASSPILLAMEARLSLAGAQQKIPLFLKDGEYYIPQGDAPSNVIVKPNSRYSANEYLCTRLAALCGLDVPACFITDYEGQSAYVSYRYDRAERDGQLVRIHQEDFCQAAGILPEHKYPQEGGPVISTCIRLINENSSSPVKDLARFCRMLVFNFLIGNCDAHGKNYSFLFHEDGRLALSPFYDLLDTAIYPELSREMAMRYKGEKRLDAITRDDIIHSCDRVSLMARLLDELCTLMPSSLDRLGDDAASAHVEETYSLIRTDVLKRVEKCLL